MEAIKARLGSLLLIVSSADLIGNFVSTVFFVEDVGLVNKLIKKWKVESDRHLEEMAIYYRWLQG